MSTRVLPAWVGFFHLLAFFFCPALLYAVDYQNPLQIANTNLVNRSPVVSETGRVAWHAHNTEHPIEGGGTGVYTWKDGQLIELSRELNYLSSNMHPKIQRDSIIWQTVRDGGTSLPGKETWVFKEVPDHLRDKDFPELAAIYASGRSASGTNSMENSSGFSDFNLAPELQVNRGPFSNVFEFASAYFLGTGGSGEPTTDGDKNDTPALRAPSPNPDLSEEQLLRSIAARSYHNISGQSRRFSTGYEELVRWTEETGVQYVTIDFRDDVNVSFDGSLLAWQKAKAFPFGWEIMALDGTNRYQITTNFYYDMGPVVHGRDVVWYAWDGTDFEIYSWNADTLQTTQLTNNDWDDVSPAIWGDLIVWESYETREPDIFAYQNGRRFVLSSENPDEDTQPVVWNGYVVWQGYDGDDLEIYLYDPTKGAESPDAPGTRLGQVISLTDNDYDDVNPHIRDGLVVWMGYVNDGPAEIFMYDIASGVTRRLTDNDLEDQLPQTAGGYVVWQTEGDDEHGTRIFLASPQH